ncbi:PREDICTED: NAC domain-containing protein 104-like [Nicotiana attenuata]|uniref:NAC domain-containing protein 104-like n=1 Tax=Nicotiana attenuata TaxID=49451 RepID=UPI000905411C|nr:PREDICTED: NAC domain-containing protein 104-like [Nicotiana attenuata]
MEDERVIGLPPGFCFDPTDEEIVMYYLKSKVAGLSFYPSINIPYIDFSSSDPSELNEKALWGKNQWYFFSQVKENRATRQGYWKEIHMNEPIILENFGEKMVGIKKYFVYYNIHEVQSNWIMEEFHLSSSNSFKKPTKKRENEMELVLCRVHESNNQSQGINCLYRNCDDEVELSALDEVFLSIDDEEEKEISFP